MPDSFPQVVVEIAFASDPGDDTPSWTDVSDDVRSVSVRRGRSRELDRYQAGQATVVLNNRARAYDPTHTANVLPMRRIRIQATFDTVTYPVFDGYVDSFNQDYEYPNEAVAVVSATDAFKVLAAVTLPPSAYAVEVLADEPRLWFRFAEPEGASQAIGSISGYSAIQDAAMGFTVTSTFGENSLVAYDASDAAFGLGPVLTQNGLVIGSPEASITGTGAFSIELLLRGADFNSYGTIMALFDQSVLDTRDRIAVYINNSGKLTFDRVTGGGLITRAESTTTIATATDYHIIVTYSAGTAKIYINGADVTTLVFSNTGSVAGAPIRIGYSTVGVGNTPDVIIDELAVYATALSAGRAAAHAAAAFTAWDGESSGARLTRILDVAGWPTSNRDIDTGIATLQPAVLGTGALDYAQNIGTTELGRLFITRDGLVRFDSRAAILNVAEAATFGDNPPSELPYSKITFDYSDQLIRNRVTVQRNGGAPQTVEDATSIAAYLTRSYSLSGLLHDDDVISLNAAQFLVSEYKDPKLRVTSMDVSPRRNATVLFPVVLDLEIGDELTVKRRPQGVGSAIDQDVVIEGISHTFTPALTWETTFSLSSAFTDDFQELDRNGPGLDYERIGF